MATAIVKSPFVPLSTTKHPRISQPIGSTQTNNENIFLWPYPHQAGGHCCMMMASGGRICKPWKRREHEFYKSVQDHELASFVPKFYGCIEVHIADIDDKEGTVDKTYDNIRTSTGDSEPVSVTKYMLFEDLTYRYRYPCVMDIKMGTAVSGIVCKETTSTTLGFRIIGMKVYNELEEKFSCKDRFWGRQLTMSTIASAMLPFLFNGKEIRYELIPLFLSKLQSLLKLLRRNKPWTFFSSSLLFIYDGDSLSDPKVDIKMIDFAHAFPNSSYTSGKKISPMRATSKWRAHEDDGYLIGLNNLISYWKQYGMQSPEHDAC
jgi:inositol-hexakisphosphate kinase